MVRAQDRQRGLQDPILVGIADKSPLMRTALRTLLSEDNRFEVVCICKNADEFLKTLHPEHPENIRIFTERLLHVATAK